MPPTGGSSSSSAIPIVRPSSSTSSPASPVPQPNSIKRESFLLPAPPSAPASPAPVNSSTPTALSVASAANAAVFVPGGGGSNNATLSAVGGGGGAASALTTGAAEFVPRRTVTPALSEDAPHFTPAGTGSTTTTTAQQQQHEEVGNVEDMSEYYQQAMDINAQDGTTPVGNPYVNYSQNGTGLASTGSVVPPQPSAAAQAAAEAAYYNNGMHLTGHHHPALAGAMGFVRQPLQYHLYHPLPSTRPHPHHHHHNNSARSPTTTFFLPPALHISLTEKSEAIQSSTSSNPLDLSLPEEVGGYTNLTRLDSTSPSSSSSSISNSNSSSGGTNSSGFAGYKSSVYKAWKETEGTCYVLRRIEGFRLNSEQAIQVVEKWTRVKHPSLVGVSEAFTTRQFGDQSLIFVFDFYPCSQTLFEAHLSPTVTLPPNPWSTPSTPFRTGGGAGGGGVNNNNPRLTPLQPTFGGGGGSVGPGGIGGGGGGGGGGGSSLPERVLWSYIVQIGSGLKCVHQNGLAMRSLEVNRVIVTGKNRVRLASCSVMDCLTYERENNNNGNNVGGYQQEDLLSFGKLIISLACGSISAVHNLPKSVDHISRMYSPDLKNVVLYLLSKPGPRKTIEEVMTLMSIRVVDELNSSLVAQDTIERELMRELENGRLVRLLCKFGFINERPEFDHDPRWAETGDRYLIKLFRDFVFHQVDENGRPVTDLSHVVTQLNKLDCGVEEKIMLVSRDEASCLIVSYRELKNAIEGAYADLSRTG
ncbi:hypothetical protein JCM3765_004422 [Sporobolomyces pararoseus]